MKNKNLTIALLLIWLPLVDSLFIPRAFAIQWHSPQAMYLAGVIIMLIKFAMVVSGVWLLIRGKDSYTDAKKRTRLVIFSTFLVGGLQVVIISATCFWYLVAGTQIKYFKQQGNINVYTADYGVFAPVYHEFNYICYDNDGFYTLKPIAKFEWLGRFSFNQENSTLIIRHQNQQGNHIKRIDLRGFNCTL
ncbi:hypothetical protein [Pseudoalteromonas mariniglutinosa]|uniref:hypothetical protein n=1 Tax=Pseudoalteromonas mariniglutinosa TaxID=206042 RepID=UPI00384E0FF4